MIPKIQLGSFCQMVSFFGAVLVCHRILHLSSGFACNTPFQFLDCHTRSAALCEMENTAPRSPPFGRLCLFMALSTLEFWKIIFATNDLVPPAAHTETTFYRSVDRSIHLSIANNF